MNGTIPDRFWSVCWLWSYSACIQCTVGAFCTMDATVLVQIGVNAGNCNRKSLNYLKKNTTNVNDCDRCLFIWSKTWNRDFLMEKQLVLLLNCTVHLSVETSICKHEFNLTDRLRSAKWMPLVYLLAFSIFITWVPHLQQKQWPHCLPSPPIQVWEVSGWPVCVCVCVSVHADVCVCVLLEYIIAILAYQTPGDSKCT